MASSHVCAHSKHYHEKRKFTSNEREEQLLRGQSESKLGRRRFLSSSTEEIKVLQAHHSLQGYQVDEIKVVVVELSCNITTKSSRRWKSPLTTKREGERMTVCV